MSRPDTQQEHPEKKTETDDNQPKHAAPAQFDAKAFAFLLDRRGLCSPKQSHGSFCAPGGGSIDCLSQGYGRLRKSTNRASEHDDRSAAYVQTHGPPCSLHALRCGQSNQAQTVAHDPLNPATQCQAGTGQLLIAGENLVLIVIPVELAGQLH